MQPRRRRIPRHLLHLVPLLLALASVPVAAQTLSSGYSEWRDSTLAPEGTPHRVDSSQFPMGIFLYHYDFARPIDDIWPYADDLGVDYIRYSVEKHTGPSGLSPDRWGRYQTLHDSAPSGKRVIPIVSYSGTHFSHMDEARFAREILFFPFDSSQMREVHTHENVFTTIVHSSTQLNAEEAVEEFAPREAVYETSLANQTIASGIAFDYEPGQTYRWDRIWNGGLWQDVGSSSRIRSANLFEGINWNDKYRYRSPHYIAVTGHLFDQGTANNADPLLRIKVWYEVDKGKSYRDSTNTLRTADTNLRFLYRSFDITKTELRPLDPVTPNWDEYREVIRKIDFRREGMGGPTADSATAQRIDVEVIYLGGEKLALRSVALRDSVANLLMDPGTAGDDYRDALIDEMDSLVRDPSDNSLRPTVHNLYAVDEPPPVEFAGFRELKRLIERSYVYPNGDTLSSYNGWAVPWLSWGGEADWTTDGTYLGGYRYNRGERFGFMNGGQSWGWDVPSARQQDGGRWTIPLLFDFNNLNDAAYRASMWARIDTMETLWQHAKLGAATEQHLDPRFHELWLLYPLYHSSLYARSTGRPLYSYVGQTSEFSIQFNDDLDRYDTIVDHRSTRGELRAMIRLALAYGAKGMSFYKFPTDPWVEYDTGTGAGHISTNILGKIEVGFGGWSVDDRDSNVIDWVLRDKLTANSTRDTIGIIDNLYFGYRDTYRELKESIAWVKRIGPVLKRLRWRDVYSLHRQAMTPDGQYDDASFISDPAYEDLEIRALPQTEIVTNVRSWHPVTRAVDTAWKTYVELGLFETMIDTAATRSRLLDTNYVMVVNRRAFETGNYDTVDIPAAVTYRALLDTLSETRTIRLDLNMGHPIEDSAGYEQYAFVRVREVEPDTAVALPLLGKRAPLDTVLHADSAVLLTLGAGRAALLEITYKEPDRSIEIAGDLMFPGQRKFLFDGTRYHATYRRNDTIFYRRSMPIVGPEGNTGSILWHEPVAVSDSTTFDNRTPSMTFRTLNGDTAAAIVWTVHNNAVTRDVKMRQVAFSGGQYVKSDVHQIATHFGGTWMQWGTPVISRLHGGYHVVWSDSIDGITYATWVHDAGGGTWWTNKEKVLVGPQLVLGAAAPYFAPGQYPSVPPFAHVTGLDSNCAVVWQQPITGGGTVIYYGRLGHMLDIGGKDAALATNIYPLIPVQRLVTGTQPVRHQMPSIDQTQDTIHRLQEGISWVSTGPFLGVRRLINFRSVYTAHNETSAGDQINGTQFWGWARLDGGAVTGPAPQLPALMSNATWIDQHYRTTPFMDSISFSVVYADAPGGVPTGMLREAPIRYSNETFLRWRNYAMNGLDGTGSATPVRHAENRHAVLYRSPTNDRLRTSRQYYAKERPSGYTTTGRQAFLELGDRDDSISRAFSGALHDVWMADSVGHAVTFRERGPTSVLVDSIPQVNTLMRTTPFRAFDSTVIGFKHYAQYFGAVDTVSGAWVEFVVELCDSLTHERVALLDSVRVRASQIDSHYVEFIDTIPLVVGWYYVRMKVTTNNVIGDTSGFDSRYPVAELAEYVEDPPGSKVAVRLGAAGGAGASVEVRPNVVRDRAEVIVSAPYRGRASMHLIDAAGSEVAAIMEEQEIEPGRYGMEIDVNDLPAGTYFVELRLYRLTGVERAIGRLVVTR